MSTSDAFSYTGASRFTRRLMTQAKQCREKWPTSAETYAAQARRYDDFMQARQFSDRVPAPLARSAYAALRQACPTSCRITDHVNVWLTPEGQAVITLEPDQAACDSAARQALDSLRASGWWVEVNAGESPYNPTCVLILLRPPVGLVGAWSGRA